MDGKRIGVPVAVEPWLLLLRRDQFARSGVKLPFASYAALVEGFKAVTTGTTYGFGGPLTNADWMGNLLGVLHAHGGRLFDQAGKPTIDTPANLVGLTAYTDLAITHKVMPPDVSTWDAAANDKAWLSGQVAAIATTLDTVLAMRNDHRSLLDNTLVTAWPGAAGKPAITTADSPLMIMSTSSAVPELAAQVTSKILSAERFPGQLAAANGAAYSPLKAYQTLDTFKQEPWSRAIQQEIIPAAIVPFADGGRSLILDDLGGSAFGETLQMVAVGGKPPQEALRWLDARAQASAQKLGQK
jgi:hypothetical protein